MKSAHLALAIWNVGAMALGGFILPTDARADASLNCDAYAHAAVTQNQQNLALGCGFVGLAWSNDFAGHRDWCLAPATKMLNVTSEDIARASALASCGSKLSNNTTLKLKRLKPTDLLGLNPQPEPPKPADLFGLNPQPEPP